MEHVDVQLQAMYKELISSSKNLDVQSAEWENTCQNVQGVLGRISDLFEDYSCCSPIELDKIPMKFLINALEKLTFKIQTAIEEELSLLKVALNVLEQCFANIKSICNIIRFAFKRQCANLDLSLVTTSCGTFPAIAEVVEYFEDALILYRNDYFCKRATLEDIDLNDATKITSLCADWKCDPMKESRLSRSKKYLNWRSALLDS